MASESTDVNQLFFIFSLNLSSTSWLNSCVCLLDVVMSLNVVCFSPCFVHCKSTKRCLYLYVKYKNSLLVLQNMSLRPSSPFQFLKVPMQLFRNIRLTISTFLLVIPFFSLGLACWLHVVSLRLVHKNLCLNDFITGNQPGSLTLHKI